MNGITSPTHPLSPLNPISPTNPNGLLYSDNTGSDVELTPELALVLALLLVSVVVVFGAVPISRVCIRFIRKKLKEFYAKCTKK